MSPTAEPRTTPVRSDNLTVVLPAFRVAGHGIGVTRQYQPPGTLCRGIAIRLALAPARLGMSP